MFRVNSNVQSDNSNVQSDNSNVQSDNSNVHSDNILTVHLRYRLGRHTVLSLIHSSEIERMKFLTYVI
jgi:hypothetical protein